MAATADSDTNTAPSPEPMSAGDRVAVFVDAMLADLCVLLADPANRVRCAEWARGAFARAVCLPVEKVAWHLVYTALCGLYATADSLFKKLEAEAVESLKAK